MYPVFQCLILSSADLMHTELPQSSLDLSYDGSQSPSSGGSLSQQTRNKRMRTSFKHHQLRTMKSYFAINQNPDAKDLKQLSQKTGLSKRVLQVCIFMVNTHTHTRKHPQTLGCRIYYINVISPPRFGSRMLVQNGAVMWCVTTARNRWARRPVVWHRWQR